MKNLLYIIVALLLTTSCTEEAALQFIERMAEIDYSEAPQKAIEPSYLFTANRVSCYHLVSRQTDSTPEIAAFYDYRGKDKELYYGFDCAVSPDVLKKYNLKKHDTIFAALPTGDFKTLVITDVTNKRYRDVIDIVESTETKYLFKNVNIYKSL